MRLPQGWLGLLSGRGWLGEGWAGRERGSPGPVGGGEPNLGPSAAYLGAMAHLELLVGHSVSRMPQIAALSHYNTCHHSLRSGRAKV